MLKNYLSSLFSEKNDIPNAMAELKKTGSYYTRAIINDLKRVGLWDENKITLEDIKALKEATRDTFSHLTTLIRDIQLDEEKLDLGFGIQDLCKIKTRVSQEAYVILKYRNDPLWEKLLKNELHKFEPTTIAKYKHLVPDLDIRADIELASKFTQSWQNNVLKVVVENMQPPESALQFTMQPGMIDDPTKVSDIINNRKILMQSPSYQALKKGLTVENSLKFTETSQLSRLDKILKHGHPSEEVIKLQYCALKIAEDAKSPFIADNAYKIHNDAEFSDFLHTLPKEYLETHTTSELTHCDW